MRPSGLQPIRPSSVVMNQPGQLRAVYFSRNLSAYGSRNCPRCISKLKIAFRLAFPTISRIPRRECGTGASFLPTEGSSFAWLIVTTPQRICLPFLAALLALMDDHCCASFVLHSLTHATMSASVASTVLQTPPLGVGAPSGFLSSRFFVDIARHDRARK